MKRAMCCSTLQDNITGVNGQGGGLHILEVTSASTGKARIAGVFLRKERKRKPSDTGIMLCFCPFCRTDLEERFRP